MPTPAGTDCTAYCPIAGLGLFYVQASTSRGVFRLAPYFTISFYMMGQGVSTNNLSRKNVFELVDVSSGARLLSLSMTEVTYQAQIRYNDIEVAAYAPILPASYMTTWTLITITVSKDQISVTSGTEGSFVYPADASVDTTTRSYYLYFSNAYETSAGGQIHYLSIAGTRHNRKYSVDP
jgi:hypothetical protein